MEEAAAELVRGQAATAAEVMDKVAMEAEMGRGQAAMAAMAAATAKETVEEAAAELVQGQAATAAEARAPCQLAALRSRCSQHHWRTR